MVGCNQPRKGSPAGKQFGDQRPLGNIKEQGGASMNNTALKNSAAEQERLAPDDQEDRMYLEAMQQTERRNELIRFLESRGLLSDRARRPA